MTGAGERAVTCRGLSPSFGLGVFQPDLIADADEFSQRLDIEGCLPKNNLKGRLTKLLRERADKKRHPDHPLRDWSDRRVRSVFNGENGISLRAKEQAELEALTKEAQHEYRDLAQLAASLQALLYGPEADFYRPQVDAIRAALVPQGAGFAVGGAEDGAGDRDRSFAATADQDPTTRVRAGRV